MSDPRPGEPIAKRLEKGFKHAAQRTLSLLASRRGPVGSYATDPASIKSVMVIRQHNQFGDVLCTIPLLKALRTRFNLERLSVVVSPQNKSALAGCEYVTELINYDKLSFYKKPSLFIRFVRQMRRGYDVLLVPSNVSLSLTNDVMAYFVKAKVKIGPASLESSSNRTSSVYDIPVGLRWEGRIVHQYYRNMKVAEPLGITMSNETALMEYLPDESALLEVADLLRRSGKGGARKVALHAGAGKVPNRWKASNFAQLGVALHDELKAQLFVTEGPMDHETIDELAAKLKAPFVRVRNRAISFVAALLKMMDLVITNDTGIMHLAAAVGTPTLSLFGPTDPLQWAPLGEQHRFIFGKGGDINTIGVDKTLTLAKKLLQTT